MPGACRKIKGTSSASYIITMYRYVMTIVLWASITYNSPRRPAAAWRKVGMMHLPLDVLALVFPDVANKRVPKSELFEMTSLHEGSQTGSFFDGVLTRRKRQVETLQRQAGSLAVSWIGRGDSE